MPDETTILKFRRRLERERLTGAMMNAINTTLEEKGLPPPAPDCSSPPCYAHEVDPAYMGLDNDPGSSEDQPDQGRMVDEFTTLRVDFQEL